MNALCFGYYQSPIGLIEIAGTSRAVVALDFVERYRDHYASSGIMQGAVQQIEEYFNGTRLEFDLAIDPQGTDFQKAVWRQLLRIPFGQTASYGDIARAIGNPKAVRAVGGANGRNPISLVVPCHRIIGSDGSLTGYAGGLWRKEWLLKHEGVALEGVRKRPSGFPSEVRVRTL
jgi:methylated-DNA-[protein]-cysteine S-methyltransferase